MPPKILAFAGSARRDSWNKKLIRLAAAGARAAGGEVTLVELEDYPLSLFNEDLEREHGLPPEGRALKDLMIASDGFLIASPEYNSSITPLVKNTIDWLSRPTPNEAGLLAFSGKTAVLMSASPGALGGLRALVHLRSILGNIGVLVLPGTISIAKAYEAFAPDGTLVDPKQQERVAALGAELVRFLEKHLA